MRSKKNKNKTSSGISKTGKEMSLREVKMFQELL